MLSARAATPADHEELVRMIEALYVEDPSPHAPTAAGARRTLAKLGGDPGRGVAAVIVDGDGRACGYALLIAFWSNELGGEICVIDELWVAPSARGRGVATWFVQLLLARRAPWFQDAVAVELEVTPSNARARALYERLGFAVKKNATLRAPITGTT